MNAPLRGDEAWLDEEPSDEELLTAWERDFSASIECQDFDLTDRQEEKRDESYADLERRRELVRCGVLPRYIR